MQNLSTSHRWLIRTASCFQVSSVPREATGLLLPRIAKPTHICNRNTNLDHCYRTTRQCLRMLNAQRYLVAIQCTLVWQLTIDISKINRIFRQLSTGRVPHRVSEQLRHTSHFRHSAVSYKHSVQKPFPLD